MSFNNGATGLTVRNLINDISATKEFVEDALIAAPVCVWPLAESLTVDSAIDVAPFSSGTGFDTNDITFQVTAGALPTGVTLDTDTASNTWSHLVGTPTAQGSGTATIRSSNPAGDYDYVYNWVVNQANGMSEFTNSDDKYPSIRSNETDFNSINFAKVDGVTGSINSSYVFDDSTNNQVYYHYYNIPSEGFSYAYLIEHSSSSYWYAFKSNIAPQALVDGLDLAPSLTSSQYELFASDSEEFTADGITYPADDDITWITQQAYMNAGQPVSLDGVLARDVAWSFGFRVTDEIPDDFLGRVMFCREAGNYYGFKRYTGTYESIFYGRSATTGSYNGPDSDLPSSIAAGDWIIVTCNGSGEVKFYVNGVLEDTQTISTLYWENAAISDGKNLHFGKSVSSNADLGASTNQYIGHGYWQGEIADLFIANGVTLSAAQVTEINGQSDISASSNYGSITHAWSLSETMGNTFAALKGGVVLAGLKDQ